MSDSANPQRPVTPQRAMPERPDKREPRSLSELSQAVHAGNHIDQGSGAVRTPIVMANS
jgi:hypothetical protein